MGGLGEGVGVVLALGLIVFASTELGSSAKGATA